MIPTSTLIWLFATALFSFTLPIGLLLWWRRTRRARLMPFFAGALVFVVFAMVLEGALHWLCMMGDHPLSRAINGSTWLYTLYGALAAGIFEETGRYVAFRFLLTKKKYPGRDTAVSCGIGHGGIEAMLLCGVSALLYAVAELLLRSGGEQAALALTKGDAQTLSLLLEQLGRYTPGVCLLMMLERGAAVMLHIALSCFVFLAVRGKGKRVWFLIAVATHAVADAPAALYQRGAVPMWAADLWIWLVALYALRSARKCYLEKMDP